MKNLAFIHSFLWWKMIILRTNSHYIKYTFVCKRLGKHTFWTWEWKVKTLTNYYSSHGLYASVNSRHPQAVGHSTAFYGQGVGISLSWTGWEIMQIVGAVNGAENTFLPAWNVWAKRIKEQPLSSLFFQWLITYWQKHWSICFCQANKTQVEESNTVPPVFTLAPSFQHVQHVRRWVLTPNHCNMHSKKQKQKPPNQTKPKPWPPSLPGAFSLYFGPHHGNWDTFFGRGGGGGGGMGMAGNGWCIYWLNWTKNKIIGSNQGTNAPFGKWYTVL